jgi:predicted CXXCH cytochrome family protein
MARRPTAAGLQRLLCTLSSAALLACASTSAQAAPKAEAKPAPKAAKADAKAKPAVAVSGNPLAPLQGETTSLHNPFSEGECSFCHQSKDPKNPGPLKKTVNELCLSCHEDYADALKNRKVKHKPVVQSCTNCHNAHNSMEKALLLKETGELCLGCHDAVKDDAGGKVKHAPVTTGKKCLSCHNPHATDVQALLAAKPFDLCVSCHGVDGVKDNEGKEIDNIKKLLDNNSSHHGPIASKDCSACHQPHGGENFRLLTNVYPAAFYAPYNPDNYKLCFGCHNPEIAKTEKTFTLTKFRDGDRNLHYLHINREKGRTCRACHEVHASKQAHQIRDGVPYGNSGWILKVNYVQNEHGGTCAKTCHGAKTYDNAASAPPAKK